MATTLSDLKQKKDAGFIQDPESLTTLSHEDLRKMMPAKETKEEDQSLFLKDLKSLDEDLMRRQTATNEKVDEVSERIDEEAETLIFDENIEDADTMTEAEAKAVLDRVYTEAAQAIKEDANINAGVKAVEAVASNPTVAPENMEIDDLLKELDDGDSTFDTDEDEESDISEFREETVEFEDDEDEDIEDNSDKQMIKSIQDQVETIIKPFNNIIDLKSFSISTKARSAAKVLKNIEPSPTATWVLLDSKTPFTCTALGAVEIENLDPSKLNEQNGRIDALKQMYGTLFKHYASPNKPEYLEQWVKTISYSDHDNLIFGYYKATFGNSNLITYACDKCKEVKIEEVPIESCVKYKDDKTKEEVQHILKYGDPTHKNKIEGKLIQISDTMAAYIKSPSIYNIVFEFGVLDAEFTNKFANVLGTVGYIEDFYEIDTVNQQLIPIKVKEDPENITKSVKRRIRYKVEILKGLTPDQYQILTTEIAKLSQNAERISYCQPEYKCKQCDHVIPETEMSAQEMLFIRHQLALIKSLSIE